MSQTLSVSTPGPYPTAPNAYRLLWAGFFAIFASGVGFSVRGGILLDWANQYGFTMSELGGITGGGLTGFGIIIILGSFIADRVGHGRLMVLAFILHLLSAALQLATAPIYEQFGRDATYWSLYVAMFMFSIANGTCEAVVNPMVATLFPKKKTHYLNILHAGWPGGLIAGGLVAYFMNGGSIGDWVPLGKVPWLIQMSMFLVPTAIYGLLMLGQKFPKSEAGEAGVSYGTMLAQFLAPVLLVLLLLHALVGYVELGTDSWISKITGSILGDPKNGLLLFVYTSGLMFALRFFGGPIEQRLSPLGLLCLSGVFGCIGLTLLGNATGVVLCVLAATVYALGKTFLWPTMLAVASERFPRGGALVIGMMGGVGMLSAGELGARGIGFKQDYYSTQQLQTEGQKAKAAYERYQAPETNTFLFVFHVKGLDGTKVRVMELETAKPDNDAEAKANARELARLLENKDTAAWWYLAKPFAKQDKEYVEEARLHGGRMALQVTAIVPATMAVLYLLLIGYFFTQGGYKAVELVGESEKEKEKILAGAAGGDLERFAHPGETGIRANQEGIAAPQHGVMPPPNEVPPASRQGEA